MLVVWLNEPRERWWEDTVAVDCGACLDEWGADVNVKWKKSQDTGHRPLRDGDNN